MRIISGNRKGLRLKSPKGSLVRPTEDHIKEMIFNIIKPVKCASVVVDGFSGSGAVGLEFLSRGAGKCYFIDTSPSSVGLIRENISLAKLEEALVYKCAFSKALPKISEMVDYFYLDPPFSKEFLLKEALLLIDESPLLNSETLVISESSLDFPRELGLKRLKLYDRRDKKNKSVSFFAVHKL